MTTLKQIQEDYITNHNEIQKIKDREIQRERQIERLKTKRYKLQDKNWWGESLVRPIMELVKNKYPSIKWDDKHLVPMGLSSRISIFGKTNDEKLIGLAFIPYDLSMGQLNYETGEKDNTYMRGSIGELNSFNRLHKTLENIDELYVYIEKQLAENN